MQQVDAVIRQSLSSQVPLINQISEYIIHSGGKRLRPALVLMAGDLAGEVTSAHRQLATIVEFIHTATLLHDDVVDASELRRGKSTANHVYGNPASVLVGDFLYSRAFQMMVKLQNMRVMDILADATNIISEGEVLQLLNVRNIGVSEQDYLRVIHFKTAKLFEAATRLGAVQCQSSPQQEEGLAAYGMHLGTAFQLVDDVLDLTGDSEKIGKTLGNDLAEGKVTLPMLYAIQQAPTAQAELVKRALLEGRVTELQEVLEILHTVNAFEYVRSVAQKEVLLACQALDVFPSGAAKQALLDLAHFSVSRQQ
ncbi:octaprenyl-diphosphate synthase [Methylophilus rhizosphaerae]|uniref:Octaprenyl diphosphate synthase n=1 Tax=Methylophilus rhizosphaerae TaxID=492660 RepID=A0A1G8ZVV4_9PROT|nr:polyprenyl synthetase family protein [Methylophilus rhizosphaerae]SDK19246.1 octaprenyl-diphosphate synthase [Methylophilus rhizosphaerae]